MGAVPEPSNAYRIVVAYESGQKVADPRRYGSFTQAQSRIAALVREHSRQAEITAIILARSDARDTPPRWSAVKVWNEATIARIQAQNAGRPPVRPPTSSNAIPETAALPVAAAPAPRFPQRGSKAAAAARRMARLPALHKPTRWQFAGTAALLAIAVVAVFLVETGGRPFQLFAAVDTAGPTIKHELPFDAEAAADSTTGRSGEALSSAELPHPDAITPALLPSP